MRDKLFALVSIVVLALAIAVPTTAQFASNDRSFVLKQTASANVTTPATGSVAVFRDNLGAFSVKDSGGLVGGLVGRVTVVTLADSTTLTAAHLGKLIVYDGAANKTLTLPEITSSNIGMQLTIFELDADDIIVSRAGSADQIVIGTTTNATTVTATTVGAYSTFTAISADKWAMTNTAGTWT